MVLLKLLLTFFFVKCSESWATYNSSLTYTLRFQKLRFYPNITGNYTINQYNQKEYINGYFTINSPKLIGKATNVFKNVVVFDRCNTEGVNCEYFQTWTFSDVCLALKDKNQIWSTLYGAFDPPALCPLDKTYYQMKNATVDVNQAIRWYPDVINYHWKVTQKFYAGDTVVGSYMMHMYVFGYRKRNAKTRPPKTSN